MIGHEHVTMMARYNRWQNESLYGCASALSAAARQQDRGAFFGSIQKTLTHIYWGDKMWLSRFGGTSVPRTTDGIPASVEEIADWGELCAARPVLDGEIEAWAATVTDAQLAADFTWMSGAARREVSKPFWFVVTHMFNHQTHHRGQVHAMLTAAGQKPDDTDLFLLPAV